MAEITRWRKEHDRVNRGRQEHTGIVTIDKNGKAIKIVSPSQTTHIRGDRLRELREFINEAID